jgi:hypothetical protein
MSQLILPIVHLCDTEGPLYEPLNETFIQLKTNYNVELAPTKENLENIQKGIGIPSDKRDEIMEKFSYHRLNHNSSWSDIDKMCETLFSKEWRYSVAGDSKNPYVINWNCMDHIGFHSNPRRRPLGPNIIYQYYENRIKENDIYWDRLDWHYHPIAFNRFAHRSGTSLNHYPYHYSSLCHRVIDCLSFPAVFRPGFHIERMDLNLFLEQWIPFDYGNQSYDDPTQNKGRFENWEGATKEWKVYHPSIKDPRVPGFLTRSIARCLNIGTNFCRLTEEEIEKAFSRCAEGKPTILAYTNHDFRDMVSEIEDITKKIINISKTYKDNVRFKYCTGVEAMRLYYNMPNEEPVKFDVNFDNNRLDVICDKEIFSSQPFLAIQTFDDVMYHDNFCFGDKRNKYFYVFDEHSIPIQMVKRIGIAANDSFGNTTVYRIDLSNGFELKKNYITN